VATALLILGMGACTFTLRIVPLGLARRWEPPAALASMLKYMPPAVLAAISLPAVLAPGGGRIQLGLTPYLVGGLVTLGLALVTRRFLLVFAAGAAAFALSRHLLGG